MAARLRAVWRWASVPANTPGIRDFVAMFCLIQGGVRLIDGAVFAMLPTVLATQATYGIVEVLIGFWLLSTRWLMLRPSGAGRLAAAAACGLFVMLAVDILSRNATSGIPALLFAWVMAAEARYVVAGL